MPTHHTSFRSTKFITHWNVQQFSINVYMQMSMCCFYHLLPSFTQGSSFFALENFVSQVRISENIRVRSARKLLAALFKFEPTRKENSLIDSVILFGGASGRSCRSVEPSKDQHGQGQACTSRQNRATGSACKKSPGVTTGQQRKGGLRRS